MDDKDSRIMQFKCKDIGMKCGFEVKGAVSREEVAEIAGVHARRVHNITSVPPDLQQKINAAIKN